MMNNFDQLLKKEIFESTTPKKVLGKLNSLFDAFSLNKDVLLIVDDYYHNNLVSNTKFSDSEKKEIYKTIKNNWLAYWTNKDVQHDDLKTIKKYFNSYNVSQQEKLNVSIEKHCGKECMFVGKIKNPLTIALAHYRKGNAKSLEQFVHNASEIKNFELYRIACVMEYNKLIDNTLPIYVEAFKKCHDANLTPSFELVCLLKQPANHFEDFAQLTYSMYDNYSDKHMNFLYKSLQFRFGSELNFAGSVAFLLSEAATLNSEELPIALKNIELSLNNDFIKQYVKNEFSITNTGIEMLFQIVPYIVKNYDKTGFYISASTSLEFIDRVENLKTVHSYILLNESINENTITHKKMKI